MQVISSAQRTMYCGANDPIAARIRTGEEFVVETTSFTERYSYENIASLDPANAIAPLTGPIWVEGARPGQTLRIEVREIHLARDFGCVILVPGKGALGEYIHERVVRGIRLRDGFAYLNETLKFPVAPMLGKVSVAPAGKPVLCNRPGPFGGNMDNTHLDAGARLYLPIFVEGAYLGVGDGHALMSDGEGSGSAVECELRVKLYCTLLDDFSLTDPVVVSRGRTMTVAEGDTMEVASKRALHNMALLLAKHHRLSYSEAAMLTGMVADLHTCQIVNPLMSMKVLVQESLLPLP
jgi:amidase